MFPYKTSIQLDKNQKRPLYLQLSNQLIELIKHHYLPPNTKILSSRELATTLGIHRKTVVACYEELLLQGWIESIPKKGTYVHSNLPILQHQNLKKNEDNPINFKQITGFSFYKNPSLSWNNQTTKSTKLYLNDGISDVRLTPKKELSKIYNRISNRNFIHQQLSYGSTLGNDRLQSVLVEYLNKTRGLHINKEQILITRGSQMGIYLASQLLLKNGDIIIVGQTNYASADTTFLHQKAILKRVTVDNYGICTDEIASLCKKQKIKAVYVTSHHHHPTTVTLSAERRMHLLNLAKTYQFAIIEDDYDYDFNYKHAPILPLASHDTHGNVIYIGSVCKTVAPVYRIGYLIAPKEFIKEAGNLRRIIDRQGDAILEMTFAEFIANGDLDRHIKKVIKIYRSRRDLFCKRLRNELGQLIQFKKPNGGMAIWAKLHPDYSWEQVAEVAKKHELEIGNWKRYDIANNGHNSIRIGFASYNENEIEELIKRLKSAFKTLINKQ